MERGMDCYENYKDIELPLYITYYKQHANKRIVGLRAGIVEKKGVFYSKSFPFNKFESSLETLEAAKTFLLTDSEFLRLKKLRDDRGRKPNEYKKGYFYQKEENAVIEYINAENAEEKNQIFEDSLRPALEQMIEIIIRRYKLYPKGEDFNETFDDALAFIITKIDRYKQENGRAYSYIQTICKNHLIGKINDLNKNMVRNLPYEDVSEEINEDEKYSYYMADEISESEEIINETIKNISELILNKNSKLSKNEILIGKALVEVLSNWDDLLDNMGSNKFNKSSIMLYIKESTNLPTKEIGKAMRKYKTLYFSTKQTLL